MDKKFVVTIPSYNNLKWCEKNIQSVLSQRYSDFRIIITDDCSDDGSGEILSKIAEGNDKVTLIKNKDRLKTMANIYQMGHLCKDDEIIVHLDGDDWLAHDNVLSELNKYYTKHDVWTTYGQHKCYPDESLGTSRQVPQFIIDTNGFRKYRWCSSHLRTYYAWLFKRIKKEDFMYDGKFFSMTSDLAVMFPILEMAGKRQLFIHDVLYVYNCENPISDYRLDIKYQQSLEMYIRYTKKPYQCIEGNLFSTTKEISASFFKR